MESPSTQPALTVITEPVRKALRTTVEPEDWMDWKWQLRHAFEDPVEIAAILGLPRPEDDLRAVTDEFMVRVTPYYLNVLSKSIRRYGLAQVTGVASTFLPSSQELAGGGTREVDGMGEEGTHPQRLISKLYSDRALLFTTNVCPTYCRYCFRKRKVGRAGERGVPSPEIATGIQNIEGDRSVRDVIISGGEPLMQSDDALVSLVEQVGAIDHVSIIRIDTKFMAVFPHRISEQLATRLVEAAGRKVLHFTFHFVHPLEVTDEVRARAWALARHGVLLNAYTPLLKGVNDNLATLKRLFLSLAAAKIRPYYLVQNVTNRWNQHFQVPLQKGRRLIDRLAGKLSGLALPQYIVYLPAAGGKVVVNRNRVISRVERGWLVRSHDGREILYYDPAERPR